VDEKISVEEKGCACYTGNYREFEERENIENFKLYYETAVREKQFIG